MIKRIKEIRKKEEWFCINLALFLFNSITIILIPLALINMLEIEKYLDDQEKGEE